jgi:hypothetical protein
MVSALIETGDGAGYAEAFVAGAGAEAELVEGGLKEFFGVEDERAVAARGLRIDAGVGRHSFTP